MKQKLTFAFVPVPRARAWKIERECIDDRKLFRLEDFGCLASQYRKIGMSLKSIHALLP